MKFFHFLFFLFSISLLKAQVVEVPTKYTKTVEDLTLYLTDGVVGNEKKARIIYQWITHNIHLDYDKTQKEKHYPFEGADAVLKNRVALPTGYSRLMQKMLSEINIESEIVSGYTYGLKKYYKPNRLLDNHTWIAIKLNGKWKMADPAMDAGYIGSVSAKKKEDKLNKRLADIIEKNQKLVEKGKDTIPHFNLDSSISQIKSKSDLGFISHPQEKWFLVDMNKFFMRHLPANPMWQLRPGPITVSQFLENDKNLMAKLQKGSLEGHYEFENAIEEYQRMNILEKVIFLGEDAHRFYNKNPRILSHRYYHYLEILNDDEVKKYFEDISIEEEFQLYEKMLTRIDSTVKYTKQGMKEEKLRYKDILIFYKDVYRESKNQNKKFGTYTLKGATQNDKALEWIAKKIDKISLQNEKLERGIVKIAGSYPDAANYNLENPPLDLSPIQEMLDSLNRIQTKFDEIKNDWYTRAENSCLQKIFKYIGYSDFLLRKRSIALEHMSISFNDYIDTLGTVVINNLDSTLALYKRDLKKEILTEEANQILREYESYTKTIKDKLMEKAQAGNLTNAGFYIDYFQARLLATKKEMLHLNNSAWDHNKWMEEHFLGISKKWKDLGRLAEQQINLVDEKNHYLSKQAELENKREINYYESILHNTEVWENEIRKRFEK